MEKTKMNNLKYNKKTNFNKWILNNQRKSFKLNIE